MIAHQREPGSRRDKNNIKTYSQTPRTLGLKTLGFFALKDKNLKVDIKKKIREVKWTTEHSLTAEQYKLLIMQKVERARKEIAVRKGLAKPELRV